MAYNNFVSGNLNGLTGPLGFEGEKVEQVAADSKPGWIFVWDLDDTITHLENRIIYYNSKAVGTLKYAIDARDQGKVDAIFLLTNNSDKRYIDDIHQTLNDTLGKEVFDYIFHAGMEGRNVPSGKAVNYATKSLSDVEKMIDAINPIRENPLSKENLINRILFFDDQEHILSKQLRDSGNGNNYIKITPPFRMDDETNWVHVLDILGGQGGGKRRKPKTRKRKQAKRKTKKSKKSRNY
jgi:hypothetical protein